MKRYLAEKDRLVKKHKLHRFFLWDDYQKPHINFFLRWLQDNIKSKDAAAILDVGCGVGFLGLQLHDLGYGNYYGIDIDGASILSAGELLTKFGLKPRFWVESAEHTHFEDGQFDVVCSFNAPYDTRFHMGASCKEFHRILKPEGYAVMDIAYKPMPGIPKRLYTKEEMRKHLSDFSSVEFKNIPKRENIKYGVVARK